MRRFVSFGPAFVTLLSVGVVLFAAPAIVRRVGIEQTRASVEVARRALDSDDVLERLNAATRNIAESVSPSVVHIQVRGVDAGMFHGSSGSGWVFDDAGHVVTNAHVVMGADQVLVQFSDSRVTRAEIVGADPVTDVAVVKVDPADAPVVMRRATGERVHVGDRVFAFGSPFGYKFSMSEGIVSGIGRTARTAMGIAGLSNFIQTDAAVNPGNSGGPLVDVHGRLVGMNVAIATATDAQGTSEGQSAGISFAIPLGTIESRVGQIIAGGPIVNGFLGVSFSRFDGNEMVLAPRNDTEPGVRLTQIQPGGPAEKAGLKAGDLVTHIDDERVTSGEVLRSIISSCRPGKTVRLRVLRDGKALEVGVTLGEMPRSAQIIPYEDALQRRAGVAFEDTGAGIRVTMVIPGSMAAGAGVEEGQFLTTVNGRGVSTVDEAIDAIAREGLFVGRSVKLGLEVRADAKAPEARSAVLRLTGP